MKEEPLHWDELPEPGTFYPEIGESVLLRSGTAGQVVAIFPDGTIKIEFQLGVFTEVHITDLKPNPYI